MTLYRCPRCQQNYLADPFCTDGIHECHSNKPVLDQEDVRKLGDWEDYTGSGVVKKHEIQNAPNNKLQFGAGAIIDGEVVGEFTARGIPAEHMRQRQHLEFIQLKKT